MDFVYSVRYPCIFFFKDTATTEIYTLSLHDALPICVRNFRFNQSLIELLSNVESLSPPVRASGEESFDMRSEEHTSELQSHSDLVCRLLLEKKKTAEHNQERP